MTVVQCYEIPIGSNWHYRLFNLLKLFLKEPFIYDMIENVMIEMNKGNEKKMGWKKIGECPKCGAGIYIIQPWFGVNPPVEKRTCDCFRISIKKEYPKDILISRL